MCFLDAEIGSDTLYNPSSQSPHMPVDISIRDMDDKALGQEAGNHGLLLNKTLGCFSVCFPEIRKTSLLL